MRRDCGRNYGEGQGASVGKSVTHGGAGYTGRIESYRSGYRKVYALRRVVLSQGPGRPRLLELPSQRQGLLLEGSDLAALDASANRIDFCFCFFFSFFTPGARAFTTN